MQAVGRHPARLGGIEGGGGDSVSLECTLESDSDVDFDIIS